ncbi:hypothetical protein M9H77_05329 [Catharanthus roseus]|uniref:Uncharacterized protein n=1 Tax=Catharanthus roseus TaxID=4058 RepID=A0ACC0CH79_CATRO|nr:hypothetical protein M9H77_05329 [Catharanthus roseus]
MRTRSADAAKSAATPKRTPPTRKSGAKTQNTPASSDKVCVESPATATPKSSETKRGPATRGKQAAKSAETISASVASTEPQPEPIEAAEELTAADDAVDITVEPKPTTRRKTIKRVVRKVVRKGPASTRAATAQIPNPEESEQAQDQVAAKETDSLGAVEPEVRNETVEAPEKEEPEVRSETVEVPEKKEPEVRSETVEASEKEEPEVRSCEAIEAAEMEEPEVRSETVEAPEKEELEVRSETVEAPEKEEPEVRGETVEAPEKEEPEARGETVEAPEKEEPEARGETVEAPEKKEETVEKDTKDSVTENLKALNTEEVEKKEEGLGKSKMSSSENVVQSLEEQESTIADVEPVEDSKPTIEEVEELKIQQEEDLETTGDTAEHKSETCEMEADSKDEIRGKRCGIAASEDHDTLFLGNICNTWTKEAIKQKLKEYGIVAVERITLVADPKHEGLSRGFAFLEFSSHAEAMLAYKRLQKPDVVFGHSERTVKVAFAEPLREPDPEVMSQVKSVFVDGLPPQWDEDHVREKFMGFGEIARVVLARNMSTAKRKDFGFVDFTTHEAAVACVEGINNSELDDGNSKNKVRARLSNPLPKTQAVKGGMAGGFRISRSGGTFSRFGGRSFERGGGHASNRVNIQHGRDFYPHGPGGRLSFSGLDNPYPPFHGRQNFGPGERWDFRSAPVPTGPNLDEGRYGGGHSGYDPLRRQLLPPQGAFNQPFSERRFNDHYFYEGTARGMKRPYPMENPDYAAPSTRRARFEYPEPSIPYRGTRTRDNFGADAGFYPQDHYGSDYGRGVHPSFYGGNRPYGRRCNLECLPPTMACHIDDLDLKRFSVLHSSRRFGCCPAAKVQRYNLFQYFSCSSFSSHNFALFPACFFVFPAAGFDNLVQS